MNRLLHIEKLRKKLKENEISVGSWMQIPDPSVAEIIGDAGYDWVAVDLEHGTIGHNQLPAIFRALELGSTLPMVRLADGSPKDCKQALDAGAAGVIIPMVANANQLRAIINSCRWPPAGSRGVGFSRANLFGKNFKIYQKEAQNPFIVAMIENVSAIDDLVTILSVDGLDAILIGPYDLSASMNLTGNFHSKKFTSAMNKIRDMCNAQSMPCGVHVVKPEPLELEKVIKQGCRFIAYSIDSVFLNESTRNPIRE